MAKLFHDIWHGESEKLIPARFSKPESVHCIVTDPPFGVDNLSKQAVTEHGKANARKIVNDESPEIAIATFQRVFDALLPFTAKVCDIYVFTSFQVLEDWLTMTHDYFAPWGFERKAILVWEKDGPGMGDVESWGIGHEFILYFRRGMRALRGQRPSGVIHIPQVRPKDLIHPHEKPVPLIERFVRFSTDPGQFVVDPFGGSGSLVRACMQSDRSGLSIECDENNYLKAKQKMSEGGGLFAD